MVKKVKMNWVSLTTFHSNKISKNLFIQIIGMLANRREMQVHISQLEAAIFF